MNLISTKLPGVFLLEQSVSKDKRGSFVKMYQKSFFEQHGLEADFTENYYTRSREDVIRGMHFQTPPFDHAKLVTVIQGTILDVVLDLRKSSPTFGRFDSFELSRENRKSVYIPRGCAHGFVVLSDYAISYYMVSSEYHPDHDKGILWNSFGFNWPVGEAIVSGRDLTFPKFEDFESPF